MKAIVKATNLIVEVEEYSKYLECGWKYRDINTGTLYKGGSLDFSAEAVVYYWERLEHQYAGMAMQGLLQSPHLNIMQEEPLVGMASSISHALVEKYKKEE